MYYDNTSAKRSQSPQIHSNNQDQRDSNSPMKSSLKQKSSFVRYDYSSTKNSPRKFHEHLSSARLLETHLRKTSSKKGVTFLQDFYNSGYPSVILQPTPDMTFIG
jgi:hypothetical protein